MSRKLQRYTCTEKQFYIPFLRSDCNFKLGFRTMYMYMYVHSSGEMLSTLSLH